MTKKDSLFVLGTGQPFGEWLRSQREERGMTGSDLRYLSQVDKGTISRLENNLTQPTLQTVVKLGETLGFSYRQLRADYHGTGVVEEKKLWQSWSYNRDSLLTFHDVMGLLQLCIDMPVFADELLGDMLYRVESELDQRIKLEWWETKSEDSRRFSQRIRPGPYMPNFIYPTVDAKIVYSVRFQNGALISEDAQGVIGMALQAEQLAQSTGEPVRSMLERLYETSLENTKLQDILYCDKQTDYRYDLLGTYWDVMWDVIVQNEVINERLVRHPVFFRRFSARSLFDAIVMIFRWQQSLGLNTDSWLQELRQQTSNLFPGIKYDILRPSSQ